MSRISCKGRICHSKGRGGRNRDPVGARKGLACRICHNPIDSNNDNIIETCIKSI
jgi:hypothetical protein